MQATYTSEINNILTSVVGGLLVHEEAKYIISIRNHKHDLIVAPRKVAKQLIYTIVIKD